MASREDRTSPTGRLRVLFEIPSLDRGGMERVVAELALGLRDERIEPLVVCTERGGQQADRLRRAGIPVELLTHGDRRSELAALLDRYPVELLSAHYSALGTPLAAERGIPVVVTVHNLYAWLGSGILEEIRALDPCVEAYVAVSESVARFSCERFRIDPARMHVVRNGVLAEEGAGSAVADRTRLRAELGIPEEAELVVQIGRIERVKCQLALIDAVARLRAERPRLLAWIVGSAGEEDYLERLRRRIDEEGLSGNVVLAGERPDVERILAAADVMAAPSIIEGLSLAVLEAFRAGVPAVLTRVGDAELLLGSGGLAASGAHPAGIVIDGPVVDPHAANWMTLRELAGADHPPHAIPLGRALATVLDDLAAFRAAAAARGTVLAGELSRETMCRQTASLYLAIAAGFAVRRARALAADLERERHHSADLGATLAGMPERICDTLERQMAKQLHDQLAHSVIPELAATRRLAGETHVAALRTLDKLRLTNRLRAWASDLGRRLGAPGAHPATEPIAIEAIAIEAGAAGRPGEVPLLVGSEAAAFDPRPSRWLMVSAAAANGAHSARSAALAAALGRRGFDVTQLARADATLPVEPLAGGRTIESIAWREDLAAGWLAGRDERLRVVVDRIDDDVLTLLDQVRAHGARVVYDAPVGAGANGSVPVAPAALSAAALARVDDLVVATPDAALLADPAAANALAARARHLIPDVAPEGDGPGWEARADALVEVTDRLTIAVIVLCYNNRDVIEPCVESLVASRGDLRYEVVVVDNGSSDGSFEWLIERARGRDGVRVVRNSRNGCSSGRSLGIAETQSEMVVFMDSDQSAMRPGWLDPALEILRDHRSVGAVSWNAGWLRPGSGSGTIVDDLPSRGMFGRHAGAKFRTDVAFLATSGMAMPRPVLARIAGFDAFYDPTCFEDTDLSFQIKEAGYQLAYCPWLAIDHRPHATTAALKGYSSYYRRNEQYFLDKWRHRPEWFFDTAWAG